MRSAGALAFAVATLVSAPATSQARVVDCGARIGETIVISSARNMTCRQAAGVMRRSRKPIARRFTTQGFTCSRVSGGDLGGQWRCVSGARAFRFDFGD
jgi:hypothetical protein